MPLWRYPLVRRMSHFKRSRRSRRATIRRGTMKTRQNLAATVAITAVIAGGSTFGQSVEVLKARSANQDIVFGKIVSVDENRLNIMDRDARKSLIVTPATVVEIEGR